MEMEESLFSILVQYPYDNDCIESLKRLSNIHLRQGQYTLGQIKQEVYTLKSRYPVTATNHERNIDLYEEVAKEMKTLEDQETFYGLVGSNAVVYPYLAFLLIKKQNDIKDGKWPNVEFRAKTFSMYRKVV